MMEAMTAPTLPARVPTAHQRLQLSVKSLVHPKTIMRCYQGKPVRETIALRLCAAARELGIAEPVFCVAK